MLIIISLAIVANRFQDFGCEVFFMEGYINYIFQF